jgi:membrane-associated HD superfamily phosphohydrolase
MSKEIVLVLAVIFSIILIAITLTKLDKLSLSKTNKMLLTYLTIFIPLLGFILVSRYKNSSKIIG